MPTKTCRNTAQQLEANMVTVSDLSEGERERIRLIREARAMYDQRLPAG